MKHIVPTNTNYNVFVRLSNQSKTRRECFAYSCKGDKEPCHHPVQAQTLFTSSVPNFYLLKPDCLVIECWPEDVMVNIKHTEKEVIVDALCAAAILRGSHVFAPGIMGLSNNVKLNERVAIYGDIEGKCKRGLKINFGNEKLFVGFGILKMLRSDLFDKGVQPKGVAVETLLPASCLPVINESIFDKGQLLLQNLPSIICGWVVDAQPGEIILDMCAAPGNKTTHLAEMSNNQAQIIAIDKSISKVENIRKNCELHGITCVRSYTFDSTKCCSNLNNNTLLMEPPYPENSFDKILLDAPCSGLGLRPQIRNKMTLKMLSSYQIVQKKLLTTAVRLLKVNGKLIYSTCTITLAENENMVEWTLNKFQNLKLVAAEPLLGGLGSLHSRLTNEQRILVQRFGPSTDELRPVDDIFKDTIGFFIASFVKTH